MTVVAKGEFSGPDKKVNLPTEILTVNRNLAIVENVLTAQKPTIDQNLRIAQNFATVPNSTTTKVGLILTVPPQSEIRHLLLGGD
jgi:hypothetical protein